MEPLFYEALRYDRGHDDNYYGSLNCKIPFLNGGLFDPINDYDWAYKDINLPNELFSNNIKNKEGDTGSGILDVFDRFNFTVKEDEPLDKEVAIDPEMLGKVFENLLEVKDRKSKGTYYTPREIVHYMCQQSLVNHLFTELNNGSPVFEKVGDDQLDMLGNETKQGQLDITIRRQSGTAVPKEDIEFFIIHGGGVSENESVVENKGEETKTYSYKMPQCIRGNAELIDQKLADIKVCDPAVGSGAFLVSMMTEIVKARNVLSAYIKDPARTIYRFKRACIEKTLYGVDIDPGAVEIAKLRLWLSLIVEEEDIKKIRPLPNLDYKIVCGNSLLGVEKNLFNNALFIELEKIKPLYFDETSPIKKQEYRNKIDDLINQITNRRKEFDFEVYFSEVFHKEQGFDVLIANPPYIGEKGNMETFRKIKKYPLGNYYLGKMDIFYFFFHLALNLGKKHSIIAFITTNYYLTAFGAKKLRRDFKERAIIRYLINFNELKIFESAQGQHNMITIMRKAHDDDAVAQTCITKRKGLATQELLQKILHGDDEETQYFHVAQEDLYDGDEYYIRLSGISTISDNPIQIILEKVKKQGSPLGVICNVNQGIVTGADKVSQKHIYKYGIEAEIGEGIFVLSEKEVENLNIIEEEKDILKTWFKNSNIKKYFTNIATTEYLIDLNYTSRPNINDYPSVKGHLFRFKKMLENRPKPGTLISAFNKGYWWVLTTSRQQDFNGPKIVAPQRSPINTFGYNEVPWYAASDVFYITKKDRTLSLKYILALLNSKIIYLWLYFRGKRKGETLELIVKPLSEIPIKKIPTSEQKPFIYIVDKILAITKDENYLKNAIKQAQVKSLEREIDQLVYKLYELTPEEIKIVEGG